MPGRLSDDRDELIDALRLSAEEGEALADELDRAPGIPPGTPGTPGVPAKAGAAAPPGAAEDIPDNEKRWSKRLPYRDMRGLVLDVTHPGGTTARFLVKPRNLSKQGLAVLHGGFLHPGTRCSVPLKDLQGQAVRVDGRIVACRMIRGRIHELGIQFDHAINVASYVLDPEVDDAGAGPVTLPTLRGRVLIVDEWRDERAQLHHDLQRLGLEPIEADGGAEAIRLVREGSFDLILTGAWLGDMSADNLIGALRDAGCKSPIVGVFAGGGDAKASTGLAATIQKPYRVEGLAQTLLQFLKLGGTDEPATAATATPADPAAAGAPPAAFAFLQGLEAHLDKLSKQLDAVAAAGDPTHALQDAMKQLADLTAAAREAAVETKPRP